MRAIVRSIVVLSLILAGLAWYIHGDMITWQHTVLDRHQMELAQ